MQHPPAVNFPVKATEAPKKTDAKRPFSMYAPSFQPSGEDIVNNEAIFGIMRTCLRALGIEEKDGTKCIELAKLFVTKPHDVSLSLRQVGHVVTRANQFLIDHDYEQKVIRCQSVARRRLARKKFQSLASRFLNTALGERANAFRELVTVESKYVQTLNFIVATYLGPLSIRAGTRMEILSPDSVKAIFSNIKQLSEAHAVGLEKMREVLKTYPHLSGLSSLFLEWAPHIKLYGEYALNYRFAIQMLEYHRKNDEDFRAFLKEVKMSASSNPLVDISLEDLLTEPFNHLPKYRFYLETFIKATPENFPDYNSVHEAFSVVAHSYLYVMQCTSLSDNHAELANIERSITGQYTSVNSFGRKHIYSDEVNFIVNKKKIKARLYLMNDVLILAKLRPSSQPLRHVFTLSLTRICIQHDAPLWPEQPAFVIVTESGIYTIGVNSEEAKFAWLYQLKTTMEKIYFKLIPGNLYDIIKREKPVDGIPSVVRVCVEHIKLHDLSRDDLLKVGTSRRDISSRLQQLQHYFERTDGPPPTLSALHSESTYNMATVLLLFINSLTDPIVPVEITKKFFCNATTRDMRSVVFAQTCIYHLPEANKAVLRYLLKFFRFLTGLPDQSDGYEDDVPQQTSSAPTGAVPIQNRPTKTPEQQVPATPLSAVNRFRDRVSPSMSQRRSQGFSIGARGSMVLESSDGLSPPDPDALSRSAPANTSPLVVLGQSPPNGGSTQQEQLTVIFGTTEPTEPSISSLRSSSEAIGSPNSSTTTHHVAGLELITPVPSPRSSIEVTSATVAAIKATSDQSSAPATLASPTVVATPQLPANVVTSSINMRHASIMATRQAFQQSKQQWQLRLQEISKKQDHTAHFLNALHLATIFGPAIIKLHLLGKFTQANVVEYGALIPKIVQFMHFLILNYYEVFRIRVPRPTKYQEPRNRTVSFYNAGGSDATQLPVKSVTVTPTTAPTAELGGSIMEEHNFDEDDEPSDEAARESSPNEARPKRRRSPRPGRMTAVTSPTTIERDQDRLAYELSRTTNDFTLADFKQFHAALKAHLFPAAVAQAPLPTRPATSVWPRVGGALSRTISTPVHKRPEPQL